VFLLCKISEGSSHTFHTILRRVVSVQCRTSEVTHLYSHEKTKLAFSDRELLQLNCLWMGTLGQAWQIAKWFRDRGKSSSGN